MPVVVDGPADHPSVGEHDGAGVRAAFRPGMNRWEKIAVGGVVNAGEWRRVRVAVDFDEPLAVSAGFLKKRRQDIGRPGDAVGGSQGTVVVGNGGDAVHDEAMPLGAAPVPAKRERDGLAAVGRKQMSREFRVLLPGE